MNLNCLNQSQEYKELIQNINIAYSHFNSANSDKSIEAAIYEINAAKAKIDDYLIKIRRCNG